MYHDNFTQYNIQDCSIALCIIYHLRHNSCSDPRIICIPTQQPSVMVAVMMMIYPIFFSVLKQQICTFFARVKIGVYLLVFCPQKGIHGFRKLFFVQKTLAFYKLVLILVFISVLVLCGPLGCNTGGDGCPRVSAVRSNGGTVIGQSSVVKQVR